MQVSWYQRLYLMAKGQSKEVLESLPVKLSPHILNHCHHQLQTMMLKELMMKDHPRHGNYHGNECHVDILNLGAAGKLEDLQMDGNFVGRREFESWEQIDMVQSSWKKGLQTMLLAIWVLLICTCHCRVHHICETRSR